MSLTFLKQFKKTLEKMDDIVTSFSPPSFWYSIGNYAANHVVSGSFHKGIPQGRITTLAGPSGSGKSFLMCNILKNAQDEGAFILVLDSENAIDMSYLTKIGVDTSEEKFMYAGVTTFNQAVNVMSEFIKEYTKAYGVDNPDAPRVIIALDSLDMLITDTENEHFNKGEQRGDQGQRAKQAKHMLRTIVSRIKRLPFAFLLTHQVYPNTDLTNGQGMWIINNAVKYSASQIFLVTNTKLKDGAEIRGVNMKIENYKSRFTQPGKKTVIEVPYDSGMSKFSGFLDLMEEMGVVKASGAWKKLELPGQEPISFQSKNLDEALFNKIMQHPLIKQAEIAVAEVNELPEEVAEEADQTAS